MRLANVRPRVVSVGPAQHAGDPAERAEGERRREDEHRGDQAGVGPEVVAEGVVARVLAPEDGPFLTHPLLEERMTDAIDERNAACARASSGAFPS